MKSALSIATFQQTLYSATAVLADVGHITRREARTVARVIEGEATYFDVFGQLQIHWAFPADTMGDALDAARATVHKAMDATGAFCPRVIRLDVRETER